MLSAQKKKRKEDMYAKLERCKMKADFPWGNFIRRVVVYSAQGGVGGDAFHTKKERKRGYVHKIEKGKDESGFPLG